MIENEKAFSDGVDSVANISKNDLLCIGATLYWGEGMKSPSKPSNQRLVFSNSDPKMIKVFIKFIRLILMMQENSGQL